MLFGASSLKVTDQGLECDQWLPIVGNVSALDDVERLKDVLDHSLLRVFEGLGNTPSKGPGRQSYQTRRVQDRHDEEGEGEADQEVVNMDDPTLSPGEVVDLDRLTSGVVKVLNMYVSLFVVVRVRWVLTRWWIGFRMLSAVSRGQRLPATATTLPTVTTRVRDRTAEDIRTGTTRTHLVPFVRSPRAYPLLVPRRRGTTLVLRRREV